MIIQSVLLAKQMYRTRTEAKKWIGEHGFKTSITPDPNPESKNWWRFRQIQPEKFKSGSFRLVDTKNDGVRLVMGLLSNR